MAAKSSGHPLRPEGPAPSQQAAAEVGAMVAEQVRRAIESAERSADELRLQALDSASADPEAIARTAAMVLGRLDRIEAQISELLRVLRDEVERISAEGERPGVPAVVAPPNEQPAAQPPAPASPHAAPTSPAGSRAPPRRHGLFRRRRRTATAASCAVCGRNGRLGDEDLDRWAQTADLSLCPDCRDGGWQLPPGAPLPYRPSHRT